MGKYEPFKTFLESRPGERVPLTFSEVEAALGFPLPNSKRYPAWWSNNPSNNPLTAVWLAAGFQTEDVDIGGERLVFRRVRPPSAEPVQRAAVKGPWPGYGAMRGTVRVVQDHDLTSPADPDWGKVYE